MSREFDVWSIDNAFTKDYFPRSVVCELCKTERHDAHMCVYNSGEIVKMQPCPEGRKDLIFLIKYKNYICKSCFTHCKPDSKFVRRVRKSLPIVRKWMNTFDKNFVNKFIENLCSFLVKETILTCVPCSLKLIDYRWKTYINVTSSFRKRRLESTLYI